MSRNREPIEFLTLKGRSHLTRAEILDRRMSEIGTPFAGVPATPEYLTDEQAAEFEKYARLLDSAGLMSELDTDSLARYVIAAGNYYEYEAAAANERDPRRREQYYSMANKAFHQAHAAGASMCLTPASRAHLTRAAGAAEDEL